MEDGLWVDIDSMVGTRSSVRCASLESNNITSLIAPFRQALLTNPSEHNHVALKALTRDTSATPRLRVYKSLARGNPSHPGRRFINAVLDTFRLETIGGDTYEFLVQKPMRQTFEHMLRPHLNSSLPVNMVKSSLARLLLVLDYLHSECRLVHTSKNRPLSAHHREAIT